MHLSIQNSDESRVIIWEGNDERTAAPENERTYSLSSTVQRSRNSCKKEEREASPAEGKGAKKEEKVLG